MKVLIINSYAGSLTLAASQVPGVEIIGSYEDEGYGLSIQKENFPNISYRAKHSDWPVQDLSETIVLAHPPCAAFSQQNASASARGTDAKKFQCTINVLNYAFRHKALALAIESVQPALEGAREVHDRLAEEYGYDTYRILENAVSHGLPQWRPRFWCIFIRKGVTGVFTVQKKTEVRRLSEVIPATECPVENGMAINWLKQVDRLTEAFGSETTVKLLGGSLGYGSLPSLIKKNDLAPGMDGGQIAKTYCEMGNFMSHCLRILNPRGFATTLLFDSWWAMDGRPLNPNDYKAIMGFPWSYKFPGKTEPKFREFLSRGVCPPIAKWILDAVIGNVTRRTRIDDGTTVSIEKGATADFNLNKRDYEAE
jgi:hypothetical protein